MVKTEVEIELHGFESLARKVEEMRRQCSDLRPMFEQISVDFYKDEKKIFNLRGPGKYTDLKDETKKRKERFGITNGYPILFFTGRLAESLIDRGGSEAINTIKKDGMIIGTAVPYAVYHHSEKPRTKMPWRPLWDPSPDSAMWQRWGRIIQKYVEKIEKGLLK